MCISAADINDENHELSDLHKGWFQISREFEWI